MLGRSDDDFFPETIAAAHGAEDDAVLATGVPFTGEEVIDLAAGRSTILVSKTRSVDGHGRALVVCTATDISKTKAAEFQARQSDAAAAEAHKRRARATSILRGVLDSTDAAIFSIDREYRYTSFNAAHEAGMRQLYGVDIKLGERLPDYQVPVDWEAARVNLNRALAGESFVEEVFSGNEALSRRFYEITHHPIRDFGRVVGAAVFARDITERRSAAAALHETEERLRQAQKMDAIGRLSSGIAHDFNNLLTVILSSVSFLRSEGLPKDLAEDVEEIGKAGERAKSLTSQLLSFSRRQPRDPVVFDVNARLREIARLLSRIIGEDIKLTLDLSHRPALVSADPTSLDQAVMNLVVNARDAMPTGGTLIIRTADAVLRDGKLASALGLPEPTHVMLRVSDSGKGISPEVRAHLFEPFFTTKPVGQGTGLGLAIVYGAVQQAGGEVDVVSEPDRGSVFTLYFPLATATALRDEEGEEPSPRAHPGESVLLVEDDDQVRRAAQRALQHLGYEVYSARNLAEALERVKFAPSPVSVLLADVVLPDADGLEVSRTITQAVPGIPVLFISGFPDEVLAQHGVALVEVLPKPFTPEALGRRVRQVIDASISARALAP